MKRYFFAYQVVHDWTKNKKYKNEKERDVK